MMTKNLPLLALLLSALYLPAHALEIGQSSPAFSLPGPAGAVRLDDFKGKIIYLDFWASWCGPCKQSFPWMNEMQTRYGSKGLQVVAINVDKKVADAGIFLKDHPATFSVAFDAEGKTPASYGLKGMPGSVLIGPDGKVLLVHNGFVPADRDALEQHIKQALAGKDKP
ncbi:TlpA disulfide reductase family protein [Actimicrobium sp. CCI2.3]|uniref:TlpA family protein disulfide reductase n=1 Tax=Actimicrobium sp. CCI2.3 TaxID=3048616 RepID=UPI002AB41C90|nr:TlpA disulfide reductase family protein [Actimicrobium sp. CCI2.3]MDY7576418.1 TlpA disulfide reductase family protein [Actimicrobium sp. CCI2.3]MEB0021602.1 TlpA disulfide reductase family protein [Actimicrobium sp. CCI2.3]